MAGKTCRYSAVFATVAGIVTSLGLGTMQINAGFNKLFGIPTTLLVQIGIVVVVSILYIGSAVSGIEKGIGDFRCNLICSDRSVATYVFW